jgi:cytochrome c556
MRPTLIACALFVCACVPQRNLPPDQINQLTKLEQVMDVQSTIADPQFKKIGLPSYTDADFAAFADVGARIQTTSAKVKQFSKGPGFDQLANQLSDHAKALADAAAAKDAAAASKALADMKATCKTCHKQFK